MLSQENISLWGFVDSCDYLHFVNDMNCENDTSINYWHKKSPIFKKDQLPYPWSEYLLTEPIEAKIVSINASKNTEELEFVTSIVTIDQGTISGLREGMILYSSPIENYTFSLQIFEINESTSKGYAEIYHPNLFKQGIRVSTKCN